VKEKEAGNIESLYVIGCLSERYVDELQKEIPDVDKYFGVNSLDEIARELNLKVNRELLSDRILTGPGHFAYLKISEGCDRTCAFCAIPAIRGKAVSRSIEDLVKEASVLAGSGVKELILIAQDLSYYGLDRYHKQMLPELLKELLTIDKLNWIRLHYLYPANFPEELIGLIRDNTKICSYIDIPIQHISEKVLKNMRRSHSAAYTRRLLGRFRDEIPDAAIRTTLITGHPGEGQKEFEELKSFVSEFRFDRLGVFPYSHEEGTYSYKNYKDSVPRKVKESRASEIMSIQQEIAAEKNSSIIGKRIRVIVDRREGDYYISRTEFDSPEVDQEVMIPDGYKLVVGEFYDVKITGSDVFDLFAEPV